ncbi:LysR family transcriptional regulator [Aquimarina sp. 2201CG1-2-11]|uniref:LysR family transcriptional regulator n=1 Tax=Aquimarina discodermiae TaxID=3231043 RepID=UPI0034632585
MELRHLKYFIAVAKELNFTKASEKLFISQPPLSRQIKELENELGAKLFERNNRTVTLTDAGKYFEKEVHSLLQTLEAISLKTKKIAENTSGDFRIAYISSTFSATISKLVQYLTEKYPYLNIKLYEVSSTKQINALEQEKLDLGILRAPVVSTKIESRVWYRDHYSLVFNKNFVSLDTAKNMEALKNETFVFFNKDYAPSYYNSLIEICSTYGFIPNVVHQSNNINSIIQLIRNGLGVSIVPSSISKSHDYPELTFLDIPNKNLCTNVLLATPKGTNSEITKTAISYLLS